MPSVYFRGCIGPYATSHRLFVIDVMVAFGIAGFVLREMKYPMAPLVLGIILGDLLDTNLRRGLVLTDGDPSPFFTRPISMVLCADTVLTILLSIPAVKTGARQAFTSIRPGRSRSEERRVGKECVSTCRYRWCPNHEKKKQNKKYDIKK